MNSSGNSILPDREPVDRPACIKFSPAINRSAIPIFIATILLAGCVNDSSNLGLTNTEIEDKQASHEQKFVAAKCNSANRLKPSNLASEMLNRKFMAYSEIEAKLTPENKEKILGNLQLQASKLQELDQQLNSQCVAYSTCEYQSGSTKQDCSSQKHKFLDAEKQVVKFTKDVEKIKL